MTTRKPQQSRPYPWRCHECRQLTVQRVTEHRDAKATYEGRQYAFEVKDFPVDRCTNCGAGTTGIEADDAINRALRDHLGLLHPEQIREHRRALGLTQQKLAEQIGCAAETLSRWENGSVIQSRSNNLLLGLAFLPELRRYFEKTDSAEQPLRQSADLVHEWVAFFSGSDRQLGESLSQSYSKRGPAGSGETAAQESQPHPLPTEPMPAKPEYALAA